MMFPFDVRVCAADPVNEPVDNFSKTVKATDLKFGRHVPDITV